MDNSKINQTELSYSNTTCNAKVNLFTGRLLYEQPIISMGANNFQINTALIYNSLYKNTDFNSKKIGFGNGWKLNLQQYVFLYDSIYNIDGFEINDYVYIDEEFYIHRFVEYKSFIENEKQVKVYYDKSGSGLRLYVREENFEICDDNSNTLIFDSDGKLVEVKSSVNANIKKIIEYDENNNLTSIYDNRKATRKLKFTYDNSILKKIIVNESNISFDLIYDEQNNLINVVKNNTTKSKEKVCFKYNSLNLLEYAINMKGLNAMQFDYQLENNIAKIKTVNIGVAKKELKLVDTDAEAYLGDEIFIGEAYYTSGKGKKYDGYDFIMPNDYIKTFNTFDYFGNSTAVTNERKIRIVYFFNIYGYTSCTLEQDVAADWDPISNPKLDASYNTLFKTNGWALKIADYTENNINGSGAYTLTSTNPTISSDAAEIEKFFATFLENETKYKYIENFVISFWAKFSVDLTTDVNVKATIQKIDLDDIEAKTILNKTFKDAWQYVTIPIYIGEYQYNVSNIKLDFSGLPEGATIDVADFRIAIGNYNYLTIEGNKFSDARYVRYINENEDVIENISSEFFMTESDIFKTYKNLYYKNIKDEDTFDLVYCAGTKVKEVTKVICDIGYREFEFAVNNFGISNYDIRSINRISSDKYSLTRNNYIFSYDEVAQKHYYQTITFAGFVKNTTDDYEDEYSTSSVSYYDNGNFYMQQDEYGVVTKNTYDNYGNLMQIKTYNVDDPDGESLKTVYGYGYIEEELREVPLSYIENNIKKEYDYNDPFKHLTSSVKGDNEFAFSYDEYYEKLIEISSKDKSTSSIEAKNNIVYDNYGRVKQVYDQSNRSYGFFYNIFGEILKYYENKKLIVEKEVLKNKTLYEDINLDFEVSFDNPLVDYEHLDVLKEKVYLEENNPNITTTIIDKYGRIQLQENNKDVIEYHYQDEDYSVYSESITVDKITSIEDPYSQKTYKYNYDEENRPCGYQVINNDEVSSVEFEVMQTANHDTQYIFNQESECIKSKIVLEDEKTNDDESKKYINPRVYSTTYVKTEGKQSDKEENCYEEFHQLYDYDNLGRLNKTVQDYTDVNSDNNETSLVQTIIENEYLINTLLINKTDTSSQCYYKKHEDNASEFIITTNVVENISYDDIGNITKIVESGNRIYKNSNYTYQSINNESYERTYEYDSVNRLIKETNSKLGNFEYNYSPITNNLLSVKKDDIEFKRFIYERGKKVQATIDGLTFNIEYDNFGNVNYDGNVLCHYDKRNLLDICQYTNGEYDYQSNYIYNYQGMRVKKKLQKKLIDMYSVDKEIIYHLDGSRIIGEDWIDASGNITDQIRYFYDIDGIIGLSHNGNNYSYIKDILGNITKVMRNGRTIAEYVYDAWGNATTYELNVWDTEDQFIVDNNPFRWKSHYLDLETGYYYINGKYYNPILMQYINASSIEQIIQNATVVNSLDRNAITLDNSITFEINPATIYTATMLYKDPTYEPDKYKSWWELHWKKAITYIIFGAVLLSSLILMCTPAHQFGVGMFVAGLKAAVSGAVVGEVIGGIAALFTGNSFEEGLTSGFIMGFIEGFTTGALLFCASQIGNALPSSANECDPEVPQCFKEGTLVQTKTGHKKIEDIKVNDEVWSYNEKTQNKELKKVKRIFRNKTKQWLHLYIQEEDIENNKISNEEIISTPEHKYYLPNLKKWTSAKSLEVGTKVLMSNGKYGIIVKKETESLEVPEVTYNFEVEDNHNYYVGKKSVLVHNKNCGSDYLEDTNICTKGQLVNRNAPGQKHHVIGNRPYKELQKKDWGKHLNRNDYLMKALTVDGHKGYQHWHIALDNELIEAVNNSDSLEVFQRKLNMIYSNPDIVKKFGRVNIILLLP